ncbi:uncharacterized protein BXZ73DRAFT_102717 [Epithele typhae]|uniref:uncharacterized protein n=1 Tax=Epithele typhae TaxID=378194 RepID=UPI002008335C|nr:uncharacterized protein BXZ73DRAFT_102717 [Epithele typhae]KAH9927129.1 hypothetical protein BXZ73DRAFT_102717 [Epithele typhae]
MTHLVIAGVTGVAGLATYRAALADPAVSRITLLTRRVLPDWIAASASASSSSSSSPSSPSSPPPASPSAPPALPETEVVIHPDFGTWPPALAARLAAADALVWAVGVPVWSAPRAAYEALMVACPLAAARAIRDARGEGEGEGEGERRRRLFRFVYLSGLNADPTGRSMQYSAQVKGRVERELAEICGSTAGAAGMRAAAVRPGYFFPPKEHAEARARQRGVLARALDTVQTPLLSAVAPGIYTPLEVLARFVVELGKGRWPERTVFPNVEMRALMEDGAAA